MMASAPKFSSFKPKRLKNLEPGASTADTESSHRRKVHHDEQVQYMPRKGEKERGSRRKESRDDDTSHRDKTRRSRDESRHRSKRKRSTSGDRIPEKSVKRRSRSPEQDAKATIRGNELFSIDANGDLGNLTYGSLHKYDIPRYRRAGYGCVLGTRGKIDRDHTSDHGIVIIEYGSSYRKKRELLKWRKDSQRRLKVVLPSGNNSIDPEEVFIALSKRRKRHQSREQSPGSIDYRSIEGKAKPSQRPDDSELEYSSDSARSEDEEMSAASLAAKAKNVELSHLTRTEPRNARAWLDLIDHQKTMVQLGRDDVLLGPSEERNLADIRIAMYEEALSKVSVTHELREQLLLGLMDEGSTVWGAHKLASKWKEIIEANDHNVALWIEYLNFVQGNVTDFHYDDCRGIFLECLHNLSSGTSSHTHRSAREDVEMLQVYVVLRLTVMMRQAGYHEQAAGIWQALLEYYFSRPSSLAHLNDQDELLDEFEDFWEAETPRIGEEKARGWANFQSESQHTDSHQAQKALNLVTSGERGLFESFGAREQQRMEAFHSSGPMTGSDPDEEDPYCIVLFSDIRSIFRVLPVKISPVLLVESFLAFYALPPLPFRNTGAKYPWTDDPFIRCDLLRIQDKSKFGGSFGTSLSLASTCPISRYFPSPTHSLASGFSNWKPATSKVVIRRTLQTLQAEMHSHDEVAEYYCGFVDYFFGDESAKVGKKLLRDNPGMLRLYGIYAQNEFRKTSAESDSTFIKAEAICSKALENANQMPGEEQRSSIFLWHTWIWATLQYDDGIKAKRLLRSMVDGTMMESAKGDGGDNMFDASTFLRLTQYLENGRDNMLTQGHHDLAICHIELLTLSNYFFEGCSVPAIIRLYEQTFAILSARGLAGKPPEELAHQSRTKLLVYHFSRPESKNTPPDLLREPLLESTMLFRNNTMILSHYETSGLRFRLDDRVRTIMKDDPHSVTSGGRDVVSSAFTIWAEMLHEGSFGGTSHSVRAAFEDALKQKGVKHSSSLWESYVRFELAHGDFKRAKQVFFRGLACLPWSKDYMLLAFQELVKHLEWDELKRVFNLMVEKELRIHIDLDEEIEAAEKARRKAREQKELFSKDMDHAASHTRHRNERSLVKREKGERRHGRR